MTSDHFPMRWAIVATSIAVGAFAVLRRLSRRRRRRLDVGAVSDEWIAQHRADHQFPTS